MLITGTQKDLDSILKAQDKAADLPLPPSKYINKTRINICPRCEHPITPPWLCAECGWVPGDEAQRACVMSLCEAVMVDGVLVGQIADQIANKDASKITAWTAPVATRETGSEPETRDDYFDLETPTKPDTIRPTKP